MWSIRRGRCVHIVQRHLLFAVTCQPGGAAGVAGFAVLPVNIMTSRTQGGVPSTDFKETEGLALHLVAASLRSHVPSFFRAEAHRRSGGFRSSKKAKTATNGLWAPQIRNIGAQGLSQS